MLEKNRGGRGAAVPYEYHEYEDKRLRVIFHLDELQRTGSTFHMHWHENIELLYFVGGTATVQEDNTIVQVNPGEIAVIGSNQLHTLESISERCLYYCLIIDKRLCEELEIPVDGLRLPPKTADTQAVSCFEQIIREMEKRQSYYRPMVRACCAGLLARLARICPDTLPETGGQDKKMALVKQAMQYMYAHFDQEITIDDICRAVGFSKCYFCHVFKEVTGQTAGRYLNYIRCSNARALLSSGRHNVMESALLSGFHNPSYFTKTYKALMGCLPSADGSRK